MQPFSSAFSRSDSCLDLREGKPSEQWVDGIPEFGVCQDVACELTYL